MTHNIFLRAIQLKQDFIKLQKKIPTIIHLTADDEIDLELCSDHLTRKQLAMLNDGTHRTGIKKLGTLKIVWDSANTFVS